MAGNANIDDPAVLLDLRRALILLGEDCQRAVDQGLQDCSRLESWLRGDQLPECRRAGTRAEQRYSEARIRYLAAKNAPSQLGPQPIEDQERDYKRTRAKLEELQARMQRISSCLNKFPREVEQSAALARMARGRMEDQVRSAVARLDHMLESLADYRGPGGGS